MGQIPGLCHRIIFRGNVRPAPDIISIIAEVVFSSHAAGEVLIVAELLDVVETERDALAHVVVGVGGDGRASPAAGVEFFFGQDGLLERVSGAVEVAQVSDLTIPVAKTQVIDLGTLPADGSGAALPPVEDKGFFGSLLERVGF